MTYIILGAHAHPLAQLGGKAKALAILTRAEVPIPKWFVITPNAFYDSLSSQQKESLNALPNDSQSVITLFQGLELSPEVKLELDQALAALCPNGQWVAVRSSALEEDGSQHSFAGQLSSFLFVPPENVTEHIIEVWRSGFSKQVLAYREAHGLGAKPTVPAVIVQQMINASTAGVAFGADPMTGTPGITVISGLHGLGSALVSGEGEADTFYVDSMGQITQRIIAHKAIAQTFDAQSGHGVKTVELSEAMASAPCLTDFQIGLLAQWVRYINKVFGFPQDIEWAYVGTQLYILQSRPITTPLSSAPDRVFHYWDNDNTDSWPGLTTPLTFSFVRRMYGAKFKYLARAMGVPKSVIVRHEALFHRVVGLVQGHLYYNVVSLERLWSYVPWFRRYRETFEDLIGGSENTPKFLAPHPGKIAWLRDHIGILIALWRLTAEHLLWSRQINGFFTYVDKALALSSVDFEKMSLERLVETYHALESIFYVEWYKPTLNNFLASFFFTLLGKCTRAWCNAPDETLKNDLLCGEGDIRSTEPIRYMDKLAVFSGQSSDLVNILCNGDLADIEAAMAKVPEFDYHYRAYMSLYGERCHENLKLESPNIADDPLIFLRTVGYIARSKVSSDTLEQQVEEFTTSNKELTLRNQAELTVKQALSSQPLRYLAFRWVLKNARARVRDRENIRFVQTLVMGRMRVLLRQIGKTFQAMGVLQDDRDIIHLEIEDIIGFVESTATCTRLHDLAQLRKAEFAQYRSLEPPPDSFEMVGSACLGQVTTVYDGSITVSNGNGSEEAIGSDVHAAIDLSVLKGIGCCPGTVKGRVRIVHQLDDSMPLEGGEILIARHGDPGLVMLFPSVSGLLFERGSPLSHLSIVAREMGIPAIVSVQGLTSVLKDGDWVEMDGRTGEIRKLS